MDKQRTKARRIVTRVMVFLLLGAVVNVAVAWGLTVALWKPMYFKDGINPSITSPGKPAFQTHTGWPATSLTPVSSQGDDWVILGAIIKVGKYWFSYRPTWPGFAINTLFYAAILWVLLTAPFAVRRRSRIKLGLCPMCAYDLRGAEHEHCPECGGPVARLKSRAGDKRAGEGNTE